MQCIKLPAVLNFSLVFIYLQVCRFKLDNFVVKQESALNIQINDSYAWLVYMQIFPMIHVPLHPASLTHKTLKIAANVYIIAHYVSLDTFILISFFFCCPTVETLYGKHLKIYGCMYG